MSSLPSRHSNCHQAVTAAVDATATIWVARTQFDVAPAANQLQESSRSVGYLRVTVEVSNFCKALLVHDFGNGVARASLRRAFGKGSLLKRMPIPASRKRVNQAEANASAFLRLSPGFPGYLSRLAAILACSVSKGPSFEKALSRSPPRMRQSTLSLSLG